MNNFNNLKYQADQLKDLKFEIDQKTQELNSKKDHNK